MTYSKQLEDGTIVGEVAGIVAGTFFKNRKALHDRNLHRGLMRGIAPHGTSVVLSGGYPDDEDLGDIITYTGEGGRDPKTGRQVRDQEFTGGNKALAENHLIGLPVRVIRGRKYVPDMPVGVEYRYDGMYRVAQSWSQLGRDGFKICRFRLERIRDSDFVEVPDPVVPPNPTAPGGNAAPGRRISRVTRIIRDTDVSDHVKGIHDFTCQICSTRLTMPSGAYAEGAHIKPLGRPHSGPDVPENLLCLCPNCHVLFDEVAVWIEEDLSIHGVKTGKLRAIAVHAISHEYLRYHRTMGGH